MWRSGRKSKSSGSGINQRSENIKSGVANIISGKAASKRKWRK